MMFSRNPFRIRAADKLQDDAQFLHFFGSGVLDVLENHSLWDHIQIIRSTPGGGKSSLLRLFEPISLNTLFNYRQDHEYRELFSRLKKLGAISDENGPEVLSVLVQLTRNYADLDDLEMDELKKKRIFFSLLSSRILISFLKNILIIKNKNYPDDLEQIQIKIPKSSSIPSTIPIPCNGLVLHSWAVSIENNISEILDSFIPNDFDEKILGQSTLDLLYVMQPENIFVNNSSIPSKILIMFDDAHRLTEKQRHYLSDAIGVLRLPIGLWISERLEALCSQDILEMIAKRRRESDDPIILEDHWRDEKHRVQFSKILSDISNRRLGSDPTIQIGSFRGCLDSSSFAFESWNANFSKAIDVIYSRIINKNKITQKFTKWIQSTLKKSFFSKYESAVYWRKVELIIDRDLKRNQTTLIPEDSYSTKLLISKDSSSVNHASEFFISKEFQTPYYFGFSKLVYLAASNIEQFLDLSANLFEYVYSARIMNSSTSIPLDVQDSIMRKSAEKFWMEIDSKNSKGVIHLAIIPIS